jgi:phosphohistidine phosphatase
MAAMQIYLVRHAIAEPGGASWPDDSLRPLTEEGRRRFAAASAGLARFEGIPERILTSPYVRARQTAELLAAAEGSASVVESFAALEPGHSPSTILARLRKQKGDRVALVGHEPDLGHLAATLLGAERPIPFKKGAICRIDVEWRRVPTGTLVWFLPPAALRRLGG